MIVMLLVSLPLHAEPWADPALDALSRQARDEWVDRFIGVGIRSPYASLLAPTGDLPPSVYALYAPELSFRDDHEGLLWVVRPAADLSVGGMAPPYAGGDEEEGLLSTRVGAAATVIWGPWTARIRPEVGLGAVPGIAPVLQVQEAWTGLEMRGFTAGFGRTPRWVGPGRHGNLALTDNAVAPWLGSVAGEGRPPGRARVLGRFRGELGIGLLGEPRSDVANPGFLLLDLRWMPVPVVEIGATRMAVFGGEGRPPADIGQLLLPTEPHIYGDPEQTLPDQDELAALDFRVCLPIRRWTSLPIDHVEGWWEYGGEDVIGRKLGSVTYPALAGVGNLFGGEIASGPAVITVEYARLMDDYFRWYVGHRVYHDGFTQDDRSMGHAMGGDADDLWAAFTWTEDPWRVRVHGERMRRAGVIQAQGDHLFALSTEEQRFGGGVDLGRRGRSGGMYSGAISLERVTGEAFVPGANGWNVRMAIAAAPFRAYSGRPGHPSAVPPPLPPPLLSPPSVPRPVPFPVAPPAPPRSEADRGTTEEPTRSGGDD